MTRDELEARLWHTLPRAHPSVIDSILADADAYAATEGGLTAERRRTLAEALANRDSA
jgi:hypothetical protein